jgi:hypothetical protein
MALPSVWQTLQVKDSLTVEGASRDQLAELFVAEGLAEGIKLRFRLLPSYVATKGVSYIS